MSRLARRVRILVRWGAVLAGVALGSRALLILYGTALVDQALSEGVQRPPTRLLSAPLELRAGETWDVTTLRQCLLSSDVPEDPRGEAFPGEFTVEDSRLRVGARVMEGLDTVVLTPTASGLLLADASGRRLDRATVRPAVIGTSGSRDVVRWPVPLATMVPVLFTAVVDIEDRGFLSHSGLSVRGLLRAAVFDLMHGGAKQGGSTITQQLAKVLLLKPSRTVPRKVIEAWLATLLEYRYDKRTILQTCLNRVYLSQDGGWQIQGVEAASHYYFGKRAADLSTGEAALLAGLIAAPNRFDPFTHPEAARARRGAVLAAMVREAHLDPTSAHSISSVALPGEPHRLRALFAADFVDYLFAHTSRGGDVASTLDPSLQEAVRSGCRAGVTELEGRYVRLRELARGGDPVQLAVVALTPDGRLLAMQGSRFGLPGEFNRASTARRQIGSRVKPFVVGAALEAGWAPEATLLDQPLKVTVGRRPWHPQNNAGRYRGIVTVREALVHSLNVPMVRLGLDLSVHTVAETLRRAGLQVVAEAPAILLGAVEASPLEVARAFVALVNRGRIPAVLVERTVPGSSAVLFPAPVSEAVREILEEVPRRGTASSLAGSVRGRLAAKTGTTDERRDSWFVALRPKMVMVVWVGTDGNRETGLFGATGALEIWRRIEERVPPVWLVGEF